MKIVHVVASGVSGCDKSVVRIKLCDLLSYVPVGTFILQFYVIYLFVYLFIYLPFLLKSGHTVAQLVEALR